MDIGPHNFKPHCKLGFEEGSYPELLVKFVMELKVYPGSAVTLVFRCFRNTSKSVAIVAGDYINSIPPHKADDFGAFGDHKQTV